MPLTPDKKEIINGVTVYDYNLYRHNPNNIKMPAGARKKTVAVTIHNTEWINVATNTTPAEQYVRATQNDAMKNCRVNYYVDNVCAWRCMPDDTVNWSCADGTANPNSGNNTSVAIEVIGNSKEAEENAVKLAAYLINKYNLKVDTGLRTHTYWLNVKDGKKGTIDQLNTMHNDYKNCLPIDSTELLTPTGWKSLKNIQKGDIIAQYDKGEISFVECLDVVEPYEAEVLKSRYLEATGNHRILCASYSNLKNYSDKTWLEILSGTSSWRVPTSGILKTNGLNLSDEELLLLAWIQGDGHYMKNSSGGITGIEFHLKKQRKIDRIHYLLSELNIKYVDSWCKNGSVHIRIYDTNLYSWAEEWLDNKRFTFKMLDMNQDQFEIFMEELYIIDGHKNDRQKMYTSMEIENLNFVQALCATHKTRSSLCTLGSSRKFVGDQPVALNVLKTNASFTGKTEIERRNTVVSCVTVPSSYILIRQNNHVFVVGNCPAYILPHWSTFKANVQKSYDALTQPAPAPTPTPEKKYYRIRKSWEDAASQIGAYLTLENAISNWKDGYYVYDWNGKVVYPEPSSKPNIIYSSYVNKKWLSDITNYNDKDSSGYSGITNKRINGFCAKVDNNKATLYYRVHIKGGGWLNWISKFDKNDWSKGCAGLKTQTIDAIQMNLVGLPGYQVKYRVSTINNDNYYGWITGDSNWAGKIGKEIDRIQAEIVKVGD